MCKLSLNNCCSSQSGIDTKATALKMIACLLVVALPAQLVREVREIGEVTSMNPV